MTREIDRARQEWAFRLGERYESGRIERFAGAVGAYQEALKEFTRARAPMQWALTQKRIGDALQESGVLLCNTQSYEAGAAAQTRAIAAYREALKEFTRAHAPEEWAETQVSLGNSLLMLGEKDTASIEEAIASYSGVLKEGMNARCPMVWSMARNNLIEAHAILAERLRTAGGDGGRLPI